MSFINIITVVVLVILFAGIMANSMTKPLARDEQMYCAGAALTAKGQMIYRDFSYVSQMPYHPLLCAAVYKIFDTTRYLHTGRVISTICNILTVLCILGIYRRIFKNLAVSGTIFGLTAVVLYVFNPVVDYSNGHAWNHDVVILLVAWSVWLFITTDFKTGSKYLRIALIGAALTLATCMRITTALAQLVFFLILLFSPTESPKQRLKNVLSFCAASAVVLIWPVWLIARAPRAFYLNMVYIPALNARFLRQIGMVHNKFALTANLLTRPGYLLLLAIAAYVYLSLILNRRKLKFSQPANLILTAALALTSFIIAYIPPTMWIQYLAAPAVFLIIALAQPLYYLRSAAAKTDNARNIKPLLISAIACITAAVLFYPLFILRIPDISRPANRPALTLHNTALDIARNTPQPKRILTLAPLYALEGDCDIYPELSAGVFAYRVAGFMTPADRQIAKVAGPEQLNELVQNTPPSALILGAEPEFLEQPLFESAVKTPWRQKLYDNGIIAYFK